MWLLILVEMRCSRLCIYFLILLNTFLISKVWAIKTPDDAQLPAVFRKNMGQWDSEIVYQSNSSGFNVNFLKNGISYGLFRESEKKKPFSTALTMEMPEIEQECLIWNMYFANANKNSTIEAVGEVNSKTNYLIGNDPSKWIKSVPNYKRLIYKNIYTNIDASYYAQGQSLKYDFIVKPQGDISDIQMHLDGINDLSINAKGQLEITTAWGKQIEEIPLSYQQKGNGIKKIKINYKLLDDHTFGFEVIDKSYNKNVNLIIDPILLDWCSFMGSGSGGGFLYDIAVDNQGNVYGSGYYSTGFPTTPGPYSGWNGGGMDAYVFKLNAEGTELIYATYIGGSGNEGMAGGKIVVNENGEAFVMGGTNSPDFPRVNALDDSYNGGEDAYVCRLNQAGDDFIYSTYLGGPNDERALDIAINSSSEAFIAGWSNSLTGFPTTPDAYNESINNPSIYVPDAFAARLSADGRTLIYCTFLGGTETDFAQSITVDNFNNAYVVGTTGSSNFPITAGVIDDNNEIMPGSVGKRNDGFITKIKPDGSDIIYSTLYGGRGYDVITSVAVNSNSEIFFTGQTTSDDLETSPDAYDNTYNFPFVGGYIGNNRDIFVGRLNPDATQLLYNTYVGGTMDDGLEGWSPVPKLILNDSNEVFVTGYSTSTDFPTTSCGYFQTPRGNGDIYVFKLNKTGSQLLYSTYYGGTNYDRYPSLDLYTGNCREELYVGFTTRSADLPITLGTYMPNKLTPPGNDQPVVIKLIPEIIPDIIVSGDKKCGSSLSFTFSVTTGDCNFHITPQYNPIWDFGDGSTSTSINPDHAYSNGSYTVKLLLDCPKDSTTELMVIDPSMPSSVRALEKCAEEENIILTTENVGSYLWSTGETIKEIKINTQDTYWVKTTDANNCTATDSIKVKLFRCSSAIVPNAFTPNGDGLNNNFFPSGVEEASKYDLRIYNRFGEEIFKTDDPSTGWNGTVNGRGQSPQGVYIYQLKYLMNNTDGKLVEKTVNGSVTLIR